MGVKTPPNPIPVPVPPTHARCQRGAQLTEATWKELLVPLWSRSWHMQEMKRAKISMSLGGEGRGGKGGKLRQGEPRPGRRMGTGDGGWPYSR